MKSTQKHHVPRSSVIAVRSALVALAVIPAAYGADTSDEIRELTTPSNQIEVGVEQVHIKDNAAKFGEYNGQNKSGVYGISGIELHGGGGNDNANRWSVIGTDLGIEGGRNVEIDGGEQGRYRIKYGYDELKRNYSDSYQTPFNGTGSTTLTLPGWPAPSTRSTSTTSVNGANSNWGNIQSPYATSTTAAAGGAGLNAPTVGSPAWLITHSMQLQEIGTERIKHDLGLNFILSPQWQFNAAARHEDKEGTKLTGVSWSSTSRGALLPEPVSRSTDLFDATFSYTDDKANFNGGYSGSLFRNNIKLWTADSPWGNNATLNNVARLTSPPDNEMHQLNLVGGYNFSKEMRLVVTGSYGRMTQNDDFISGGTGNAWVLPASSADAKVITEVVTAKLTDRLTKDLGLSASYKYDKRDNKTPQRSYAAFPADAATGTPSTAPNEPLNRLNQQLVVEADYALGRGQGIKAGYERQEIKRTCDGDECVYETTETKENTLRLDYRNSLSPALSGRIGYAYSERRTGNYFQENDATNALDPLLPGFRQFYLADRNRDKLRAALNFEATDRLSMQVGLDYNKDDYVHSQYGVKEAQSWVLNLDAAFAANDKLSFNGYITYEDQKSKLESLAIARYNPTTEGIVNAAGQVAGASPPGFTYLMPHTACAAYPSIVGYNTVTNYAYAGMPVDYYTDPCRQWTETQADKVLTLGFSTQSNGWMAGKLDVKGDLSYTYARTPITMTGGTYYSNGLTTPGNANNVWIAAESFPDITSKMIELRLNGKYKVDKASSTQVNYLYRHLTSEDWQYDAFTNSSLGVLATQGYIGNGMTSQKYTAQAIGVSYLHSFR